MRSLRAIELWVATRSVRALCVGLFAAAALATAPPAQAISWRPPIRPLSEDDQIDMATSASRAIGVGAVSAVRESIDDQGTAWRWMTFEPRRWLKGDALNAPLRIYFPTISDLAYRRVLAWTRNSPPQCIVFARQRDDRLWVLAEHPDHFGGGIARVAPGSVSPVERAVLRGIERQTPEGVARRSALIVVGSTQPSATLCRTQGTWVHCADVRIDSVVAGNPQAGPVRVYSRFGGFDRYEHVLLMLTPGDASDYELVGFDGGALPIAGDRVGGQRIKLAELVTRIRRVSTGDHPPAGSGSRASPSPERASTVSATSRSSASTTNHDHSSRP